MFGGFSAVSLCFSRGFPGCRRGEKFLVVGAVFLGVYLNTKERKIRVILLGQEQTTAILWANGEFHSDPICVDPAQNFPRSKPLEVETAQACVMQ